MFEMSVPWLELCARATTIYAALLILMRLSGKRTVGQFTAFDLLVVMLLSEAVSNGLTGGDQSLVAGLVVATSLIAINIAVAIGTARFSRLQMLVEGTPVLIGRDGQFYTSILKKNHVPLHDCERALRASDCDIEEMKFAFLEADGGISILRRSSFAIRKDAPHA